MLPPWRHPLPKIMQTTSTCQPYGYQLQGYGNYARRGTNTRRECHPESGSLQRMSFPHIVSLLTFVSGTYSLPIGVHPSHTRSLGEAAAKCEPLPVLTGRLTRKSWYLRFLRRPRADLPHVHKSRAYALEPFSSKGEMDAELYLCRRLKLRC